MVRVEDAEAGTVEEHAFTRSPVRIGRAQLNDLALHRPFVSSYHGLVQFDDDEARYLDLGSTNGSVLGGTRLERNAPAPLAAGSVLAIGSLRLTFARPPAAGCPAAPSQATAYALRVSQLRSAKEGRTAVKAGALPCGIEEHRLVEPTRIHVQHDARAAPVSAADDARAAAAVEAASVELGLRYVSYRGAREHLCAALRGAVEGLGAGARGVAEAALAARFPDLAREGHLGELGGTAQERPGAADGTADGAPTLAGDQGASADAMLQLVNAFAEAYVGKGQLRSSEDVGPFLDRVATVLETFARAFLELRRGHEEFGVEMGIRTVRRECALGRARDAQQLLAHLLGAGAAGREHDLRGAFADFMLHQIALLRAVGEGARALLERVSPLAISRHARRALWLVRPLVLWRTFEAVHGELAGEDDAIGAVLFGEEFARTYAEIAGEPRDRIPERKQLPAEGGGMP